MLMRERTLTYKETLFLPLDFKVEAKNVNMK